MFLSFLGPARVAPGGSWGKTLAYRSTKSPPPPRGSKQVCGKEEVMQHDSIVDHAMPMGEDYRRLACKIPVRTHISGLGCLLALVQLHFLNWTVDQAGTA